MENANVRTKSTVLAEMEEKVALGTAAIRENNLTGLDTAENDLRKLEKEYDLFELQEVYARLLATENPVLTAITEFTYVTKKHKPVKNEGTLVALEVADITKRIDLLDFCKKIKDLDTGWQYDIQKLNKSLALRAAKELKLSDTAINDIKRTFRLSSSVAKDKVEIPTSNNQICTMLQKIIDRIIFNDDGNGKNSYKVTSHDVAHLLMTYTQKDSKNALAVRVSKHRALIGEVVTVCHKIVTGKTYELLYQQMK